MCSHELIVDFPFSHKCGIIALSELHQATERLKWCPKHPISTLNCQWGVCHVVNHSERDALYTIRETLTCRYYFIPGGKASGECIDHGDNNQLVSKLFVAKKNKTSFFSLASAPKVLDFRDVCLNTTLNIFLVLLLAIKHWWSHDDSSKSRYHTIHTWR